MDSQLKAVGLHGSRGEDRSRVLRESMSRAQPCPMEFQIQPSHMNGTPALGRAYERLSQIPQNSFRTVRGDDQGLLQGCPRGSALRNPFGGLGHARTGKLTIPQSEDRRLFATKIDALTSSRCRRRDFAR